MLGKEARPALGQEIFLIGRSSMCRGPEESEFVASFEKLRNLVCLE